MTPDPTTPRQIARRDILDHASALLTEEGAHALSMRKLSQRIGASTIVLYTHFRDKQDILNELYVEGFGRLCADLEAVPAGDDPMAYVMALGRAYRQSAVRNPTYYQIMFTRCVPGFDPSPESRQAGARAFGILARGVQRCLDSGTIAPGNANDIATVLWGTLHGMISLELFGYVDSVSAGEARLEHAIQTIRAGVLNLSSHATI